MKTVKNRSGLLEVLDGTEPGTGIDSVTIENPAGSPGWDWKVLASRGYSIFHSSAWAKVLIEAYGYRPRYFCLEKGSGFAAMIPIMEISSPLTGKRGVSLPFTDHCSPITDDAEGNRELWEQVVSHGKQNDWKYIEFHGGEKLFGGCAPAATFFKHELRIAEKIETLFSNLDGNRRRNVRKAGKTGVEIRVDNSPAAMKLFYKLHCKTRERHKIPPQPVHFFEKVYDHIIAAGLGDIFAAVHRGEPVGAAVFFHYGTKALYKFGASDLDYQHLRMNDLIIWKAIEWYAARGFETLSLGRTAPDNLGLKRFKHSWGARESILNYYEYNLISGLFGKASPDVMGLSRRILPFLPSFLVRKIGSIAYRHIG